MNREPSPAIDRLAWGTVTLADGRRFKDVKLWPGGAREWDWTETGTHHSPGIQPADVEELVRNGARVVVLSRGQLGRLEVMEATLVDLEERNVEARIYLTEEAVAVYNELGESRPVGALIHSTC